MMGWVRRLGLRWKVSLAAGLVSGMVVAGLGLAAVAAIQATAEHEVKQRLGHAAEVLVAEQRAGRSVPTRQVVEAKGVGLIELSVAPDLDPRGNEKTRVTTDPRGSIDFSSTISVSRGAPSTRVVASTSAAPLHAMASRLETASVVLGLVAAALSGVLAAGASGRTLSTVAAIRHQVDRVTSTDLSRRVPQPRSADEIAALASCMNRMLDRIESASDQQRRLVADASHELRNPLTVPRGELELALSDPAPDWPDTAARVLAEESHLEHLVDELLELAALDATATAPREPVDLAGVCRDEAARYPRCELDVVGPVATLHGDPRAVRQAVRNLADNANRHSSSRVLMKLAGRDGHVALTVDDDGSGIPAGERERVFERFHSLDDGARRGRSGLGLAIVRRTAELHGGTVTADASPLGGARFTLRFPADPG